MNHGDRGGDISAMPDIFQRFQIWKKFEFDLLSCLIGYYLDLIEHGLVLNHSD